jgi:hypothetical protein
MMISADACWRVMAGAANGAARAPTSTFIISCSAAMRARMMKQISLPYAWNATPLRIVDRQRPYAHEISK